MLKGKSKTKSLALILFIGLVTIVLSACGKPITEELYSETVSQDVKTTTELTQEDKDFYSMAIEFASSENTDLSSQTVIQIINDEKDRQRKIEEEKKKRQEEIKRKQEEAEKEKQTQLKVLNDSLRVGLLKKSVIFKDTDKWIFKDVINMTLDIENTSDKKVKGFQGLITFKDMFDNDIKSLNVKYDEAITSGTSTTYDGSFEVNQFIKDDIEFRDTPLEKITVEFEMDQIIFDDGTTIKRSDIE